MSVSAHSWCDTQHRSDGILCQTHILLVGLRALAATSTSTSVSGRQLAVRPMQAVSTRKAASPALAYLAFQVGKRYPTRQGCPAYCLVRVCRHKQSCSWHNARDCCGVVSAWCLLNPWRPSRAAENHVQPAPGAGDGRTCAVTSLQQLAANYSSSGLGILACNQGSDVPYPAGAPGFVYDPTGGAFPAGQVWHSHHMT